MSCLKIQLLGPFLVTLDDQQISQFDTEKTRALLAYLASESSQPQPREHLAEMLWPERPQGAARANLRHTLNNLRTIIGDRPSEDGETVSQAFLLAARDTIQLNPASSVWVDTVAFGRLSKGATTAPGLRIHQLEGAVELYRGPFLEDITLGDSACFQEWVWFKREGYNQEILEILRQLIDCYRLWGNYEKATQHARRQVELAPWNEEAHQNVMRMLALTGQRGAALAQYDTCRRFLREELDVDPGMETKRLYEQIRDGALEAFRTSPALSIEREIDLRMPGFLEGEIEDAEPPRVVARDHELATLEGFLQQTYKGHGRVAFVSGIAGQGKTALLNEFARRSIARYSNLLVTFGDCNVYSGVGDPYMPFRNILAMLTGDLGLQWTSGAISRMHAQRIWEALPKTIPTLLTYGESLINSLLEGEDLFYRAAVSLSDQTKCLERLRALIKQAPSAITAADQSFLFEHYANFLLTLSEQTPLVIIIDDLQWADNASISLLFHLGRRLAKGNYRILILCAYRPEEVALDRAGGRHPLGKVLNEFMRIFGDDVVNLDQVEQSEGRRFVDALLDTEANLLDEDFRSALFQRTQGHPLFTVELLHALQDRGDVFENDAGYWIEGPNLDWEVLPSRVQAVIAERIDRLTPHLKQILSTASVEGQVFTAQIVAQVQKAAEITLLSQLAQELGERHHLVTELGELQTNWGRISRYRFRHILFQDYVYKQLSLGERRLLHKDVAAAMENIYRGQHEEMAVQLAHHFYQAGENHQAFRYSALASRQAARLCASDETIRHATRAIEIAAVETGAVETGAIEIGPKIDSSKTALVDLYRERGLAYETQGKFHHALADLEISCQMAHAEGEHRLECCALIDLGKLWASKDYTKSYQYFDQALQLARQLDDPEVLANSLNWMGNWHANAEELEAAIRYHHEALELFVESGNQQEIAKTMDLLGISSLLAADSITSKVYFDQAIARFRELNNRSGLASSLTGRGNTGGGTFVSLSTLPAINPSESRRDFEEALRIAREIGSPAAVAWADWSLGLLEIGGGNFGAALETTGNGFKVANDIGHLEWMVGSQAVLGLIYAELFALEQAQEHLLQALRRAEELRSQHWIHQATGTLAHVYLLKQDIPQAQEVLATVISPQTPMNTMHRRYCWARQAEIDLARGDPDSALDITDRLICTAPSLPPGGVITFLWKLKGEALAAMGRLEEANSLLHAAKENALSYGDRFILWRIHARLGRLYRSMSDQIASEKELLIARSIIEELAATIQDEALKQNYLTHACSAL